MTNIIAFDSKVKKGSETVGCVGKESDLEELITMPSLTKSRCLVAFRDLMNRLLFTWIIMAVILLLSDPCQRTQS